MFSNILKHTPRKISRLPTHIAQVATMRTITTPNGDPRMKELIHTISPQQPIPTLSELKAHINRSFDTVVVVVGFPSDLGTIRNSGRAGGAAGPTHFRNFRKLRVIHDKNITN